VVGLVGDGGLSLNLGELATLAQEKANVTLLIMNDGGYGVMRGIQDKYFGGRQYYNELHTPDLRCWHRLSVCRRGAWSGRRISGGDDRSAGDAGAVGGGGQDGADWRAAFCRPAAEDAVLSLRRRGDGEII
jgi:hypothetical protein